MDPFPHLLRPTQNSSELTFALHYPPSPETSSSPQNSLPSYDSSPESISSGDFPSSSATPPPPFSHPADHPPPYHHHHHHHLLPPSSNQHQHQHQHPDPNLKHVGPSSRLNIAHPYARLYAKKDGAKRRKIWNHALEKLLFSPHELSSMGAPHRRTIYIASLEAHVDRLHAQMISIGFFPVEFEKLERFKGLNSKTAKSMVAGLQNDASHIKLKLLELKRSNECLRKSLSGNQLLPSDGMRQQRSQTNAHPSPCVKLETFHYNYH